MTATRCAGTALGQPDPQLQALDGAALATAGWVDAVRTGWQLGLNEVEARRHRPRCASGGTHPWHCRARRDLSTATLRCGRRRRRAAVGIPLAGGDGLPAPTPLRRCPRRRVVIRPAPDGVGHVRVRRAAELVGSQLIESTFPRPARRAGTGGPVVEHHVMVGAVVPHPSTDSPTVISTSLGEKLVSNRVTVAAASPVAGFSVRSRSSSAQLIMARARRPRLTFRRQSTKRGRCSTYGRAPRPSSARTCGGLHLRA